MQRVSLVRKKLEYARFTHLAWMFIIALWFFLFTEIPHKQWVFLSVLVICAGIEPGLIVKRSIRRIKGTTLALVLMIPFLYFAQINYRLIPIFLILSAIFMNVSGMNQNRYDVKVFFTTFYVFLLTALTTVNITPEGPVVMVLNRIICTLIAVAIILSADYFLFNSFRYGRKLYYFHQLNTYHFLKRKAQELQDQTKLPCNTHTYLSKLRDETNMAYMALNKAADSLASDLNANDKIKKEVAAFQSIAADLRIQLFAVAYARLVLNSTAHLNQHLADFNKLISQARLHITEGL